MVSFIDRDKFYGPSARVIAQERERVKAFAMASFIKEVKTLREGDLRFWTKLSSERSNHDKNQFPESPIRL